MRRLLRDVVRQAVIKAELPQYEVKKVLVAVQDAILQFLIDGDEIIFGNLGKWQVRVTRAHKGRNPKTGESVMVPAVRRAIFKFYPEAKAAIRANRRGLDEQQG